MESENAVNVNTPCFRPMARWRVALVNGLIAFLILGHLYDIMTKGDHWPFSQYKMFSRLHAGSRHSRLSLVGVTVDGKEIRLSDPAYASPMPSFHVHLAFMKAISIHDSTKRQAKLENLCADYLRRYDRHRVTHCGPPVIAMRIYELRWNVMDTWARNAKHPDEIALLFDSHLSGVPVAVGAAHVEMPATRNLGDRSGS